jgi:hypothetical protein
VSEGRSKSVRVARLRALRDRYQVRKGCPKCEGVWEAFTRACRRESDALKRLLELENALTWETTCLSCAEVLDSSIKETERAEKAEAVLQRVREQAVVWAAADTGSVSYVSRELLRLLDGPECDCGHGGLERMWHARDCAWVVAQ